MDTDILTDSDKRERLVDLCYSLYESLDDLMADATVIKDGTALDVDYHAERVSVSAMNCLGDIELLLPMFTALSRIRYP